MKRLLVFLGTLACAVTWSSAAPAEKPTQVNLLSGVFGTGTYVLASALEDISSKSNIPVRIDSSETPGFLYNVKKLASSEDIQQSTMIGSGKGLLSLAVTGEAPFDKKYKPLKLIAAYNLGSVWLATLNPNIKTIKDLAGKHIGLGRVTQLNWSIEPARILQAGWNLGPDKVDISYLGTKEAVSALLDGHVDAAVVGGYLNPFTKKFVLSPQTTQLMASGRKIHFIPWGKDAVEKAIKSGINMTPIDLPANTIDGVSSDLSGFADTTGWFVAESFPEEKAYELAKLIIQNVDKFGEYHAIGKLMSKEALVFGFSEKEIAPGALKAYREAGILK